MTLKWEKGSSYWISTSKCRGVDLDPLLPPTPIFHFSTGREEKWDRESVTSHMVPGGSDGKEPTCNAGDLGSIPGSGRSPGEGNGYPLLYSHLENPMEREESHGQRSLAAVHRVTKSWTWLSNWTELNWINHPFIFFAVYFKTLYPISSASSEANFHT